MLKNTANNVLVLFVLRQLLYVMAGMALMATFGDPILIHCTYRTSAMRLHYVFRLWIEFAWRYTVMCSLRRRNDLFFIVAKIKNKIDNIGMWVDTFVII